METDVILIETVRKYPSVWNMALKEYKDTTVKENAWTSILKEVMSSKDDCKKRWKTLRDRFVRELKVIKVKYGAPYVSGVFILYCHVITGT